MTEYKNLKWYLGETIQEFKTRFNKVYNSIPTDIKPPLPRLAMIHYPDGFDVELAY